MNTNLKRNPDVLSSEKIITAGREIHGIRKGDGGKFTDFGVIESVTPGREETKKTLKGNRKGRTKTYKEVIDESTFTLTYQTSATGDSAVREWYLGTQAIVTPAVTSAFQATHAYALGDLVEAAGRVYRVTVAGESAAVAPAWPTRKGLTVTSGTASFVDSGTVDENAILAYSNDGGIGEGAFIVVLSTEEGDGNRSIIRVFPNANVQGTQEVTIQDFDGYEFELTSTTNRGWVPPAVLGDFGTAKPDGVVYDVPNSRLEEIVNLIATSLVQYVEGA